MPKIPQRFFALFFYLLGLVVFLHPTIFSHFSILLGDELDGRLILGIQEHWYQFFSSRASWLDLGMFYPVTNSLGFSDSFFLFGLSHSLFRFLGFDLYSAMIVNFVFLSFVGYTGFVYLARKHLRFSPIPSYIGGALFISAAPILNAVHVSHSQMLNVWLIPWIYNLALNAFQTKDKSKRSLYAIASGTFTALVTYNAFYAAWFAIFHSILAFALFLFVLLISDYNTSRSGLKQTTQRFIQKISSVLREQKNIWIPFSIAFLLALIPFLITYLPVLITSGGWGYSATKASLPHFADLLNTSHRSLFWSDLSKSIIDPNQPHPNHQYGFPLFTFISFVIGACLLYESKRSPLSKSLRTALFYAVISIPFAWILMFQLGDFSFWRAIYNWVPGASSIRVVFRFNGFLILPAILAISFLHQFLWESKLRTAKIAVILMAFLLISEQILIPDKNVPGNFDRIRITDRLAKIQPPPPGISTFYAIPYDRPEDYNLMLSTLDAWTIAQRYQLKTVNGTSGLAPKDYPLLNVDRPRLNRNFDLIAARWLISKKISGPIGKLDLETGEWSILPELSLSLPTQAFNITISGSSEATGSSISQIAISGWSPSEPWGTWSNARESILMIPLEKTPQHNLVIEIQMNVYTPVKNPIQHFEILANGISVYKFQQEHGKHFDKIRFKVPASAINGPQLELTIKSPDACRPSEMEDATDSRLLAFGLIQLRIDETD